MTSSDKLNQNSTEKKEKNSDAPNSENSSPNSGMMGATACLLYTSPSPRDPT